MKPNPNHPRARLISCGTAMRETPRFSIGGSRIFGARIPSAGKYVARALRKAIEELRRLHLQMLYGRINEHFYRSRRSSFISEHPQVKSKIKEMEQKHGHIRAQAPYTTKANWRPSQQKVPAKPKKTKTAAKVFGCRACSKKFANVTARDKHVVAIHSASKLRPSRPQAIAARISEGSKAFINQIAYTHVACPMCGQIVGKAALTKHQRRVHPAVHAAT